MRSLVIGGAGFIGSHLIERLEGEVISLDNYSSGKVENHIPGATYLVGDASGIDKLKTKPDIIYHLGEYSRVLTSFDDIDLVSESVIGTLRVLEYCRKNKVKLVYAGSSTKFGDAESPYSFFKAQNTETVKKYGEWFGLDYAITYFYNVYGGREVKEGKYATFIGKLTKGPITLYGDGSQRRNFTHVDDIVSGLLLVGEKGSGEYQLGHPKDYSLKEVTQLFGYECSTEPGKKGDRKRSSLDLTRAEKLGWKASINLEDYIKQNK